jgi:hypothetical protein
MTKKSVKSIKGSMVLSLVLFFVFSIGFFPIVIGLIYVLLLIPFNEPLHFILLPFLIYIGIALSIIYQVLISGLFIFLFKIKYEPGLYDYNFENKIALKWMLICTLYTPIRKIFEIFPLGGIKKTYYRLLGMKIGNNTLVGGTIMDPCLTEFGDNCTMGLYAVIYGHIHNYEKGTIFLDRIKIGDNCIIGAGALIMPGVILEDNVTVAAGALVRKEQVLKKGKTYAGVPAKEIKTKKLKK